MINFSMIARLSLVKDSDKLKGYEVQDYDSGWQNTTVRFNAIAGDNRFLMQVRGGKWKDDSGDLYLIDTDGEKFQIPFSERKESDNIERTAQWRRRILDLDYGRRRNVLRSMLNGDDYDEAVATKYGLKQDDENLEGKLEKSVQKRHEYLSDYDFARDLYALLKSEKTKDKKFRIIGEVEFQYSDKTKRWYKTYVPHKIYLVDSDNEYSSKANVILLFDQNSLDDSGEDDINKAIINGYVTQYDNQEKVNKFVPYQVVLLKPEMKDEKELKFYEVRKKRFMVDEDDTAEVRQLGIVVDLIDGAQRRQLSLEELPEEVQEAVLMGDISERDALAQYGGIGYGDRITENRFAGLMRGYAAGSQETEYKSEDFLNKPKNASKKADDDIDVSEDDTDFGSLFDDID